MSVISFFEATSFQASSTKSSHGSESSSSVMTTPAGNEIRVWCARSEDVIGNKVSWANQRRAADEARLIAEPPSLFKLKTQFPGLIKFEIAAVFVSSSDGGGISASRDSAARRSEITRADESYSPHLILQRNLDFWATAPPVRRTSRAAASSAGRVAIIVSRSTCHSRSILRRKDVIHSSPDDVYG